MIIDSTRSKSHKRWLPGRAWDFESLIYLSVYSSKWFGFFPFKYENGEYVVSKMRLAIAAFLCFLHLASQTYVLYKINYSDTREPIFLTMPENFFILLDGSIPMLTFLKSYARSFMLQRVSKVSRILSPQDFNDMAKFLHLTHILMFLFEISFVPLDYKNRQNVPFIRYSIELVMMIASDEVLLFYLYCVYVLGACFKKVNGNLQRLRESWTNEQPELTEEHESRRQGVMLLRKVKYYEDVYEEISNAVDHLNKSSNSMNIVFTVATFISITFNAYLFIQWIFDKDKPNMSIYIFLEFCAYGIYRLVQFVILIWICETAMVPAAEINITIHDLANKCRDDTVKRELRYFALQVVHRDNAITTTAFKMNGKLLSQVLSGIFMYIMILYQFSMSSNCTD